MSDGFSYCHQHTLIQVPFKCHTKILQIIVFFYLSLIKTTTMISYVEL